MTVWRVMGTETEYGISVPGQPHANAMLISSQIVNSYAAAVSRARRPRWDFDEETPLRDARGFDLSRDLADPSQLTDEDLGLANVILTNGARLYVDHAHPEYSTPEVTNPRDLVLWDKAGERVMAEASRRAATIPGTQPIHLYKHNTDSKGVSFGAHENYLMRRSTPFAPAMIEEKAPPAGLGIADPVAELKAISHDPALSHLIRLRDGRRLTALDLQWAFYERARAFVEARQGADADEITLDVLDR